MVLYETGGKLEIVTVAGYNTASLVISVNNKNDGTKFQCRITDGLGNILVSSVATRPNHKAFYQDLDCTICAVNHTAGGIQCPTVDTVYTLAVF